MKLIKSSTLQSVYDIENPRRHIPVRQILREAGAKPLNGNYDVVDHGDGYASIIPTEADD